MKRYILILILISWTGLFFSCEKDETKVYLRSDASAPTLLSPADGDVLSLSLADSSDYILFSWNAADYGFNAALTYSVELDRAGNDFSAPLTVLSDITTRTDSIMVYTLNNQLVAGEYETDVPASVEIRVRSILEGDNESPYKDTLWSDPVSITVTPFLVEVSYPSIYAPGSYQNWDPATANQLYSLSSNNIYDGYIYFPDATTSFKFTMDASWDNNYGDTGADGSLDANGDNIEVAGAGCYKINVNMNSLTYTLTKTDWGIVGDFTGWADGADVEMTWNATNAVLTATADITAGGIKFRANGAWTLNFGDTGADGVLDSGGDNISIAESGNYTITLDLSGPLYTYTIVKNN